MVNRSATFQSIVHEVPGDTRDETTEANMDGVNVGKYDEGTHLAQKRKLFDGLLDSGMRSKFSRVLFWEA